MPLYDYQCPCGTDFSLARPIAARDDRAECPDCGGLGRRRLAAPRLTMLARNTRVAHERNERAAHEPRVVRRGSEEHAHETGHRHGPGCGHAHPAHSHAHGPSRPWMLGH